MAGVRIIGDVPIGINAKQDARDAPAWAPSWAPERSTLDYVIKFATVSFLVLGTLYFMGVRPLAPIVNAGREIV